MIEDLIAFGNSFGGSTGTVRCGLLNEIVLFGGHSFQNASFAFVFALLFIKSIAFWSFWVKTTFDIALLFVDNVALALLQCIFFGKAANDLALVFVNDVVCTLVQCFFWSHHAGALTVEWVNDEVFTLLETLSDFEEIKLVASAHTKVLVKFPVSITVRRRHATFAFAFVFVFLETVVAFQFLVITFAFALLLVKLPWGFAFLLTFGSLCGFEDGNESDGVSKYLHNNLFLNNYKLNE